MGELSARSSAFPCGSPATMSIKTTSPNSLATAQWAAVAPTFPAPTMVIFAAKDDSFLPLIACSLSHPVLSLSVLSRAARPSPPAGERAGRLASEVWHHFRSPWHTARHPGPLRGFSHGLCHRGYHGLVEDT